MNNNEIKNLNTLDKVIRTVNLNSKPDLNRNKGCYEPILKRGDVVFCDFIGIGTEIDGGHFAIVWNAPNNSESITVIPLTSSKLEESKSEFTIGKIENFITDTKENTIKDSYVYVNKIKEVSRKRVSVWYKRDMNGTIIKNNSKSVAVKINSDQKERIKEAIAISYIDNLSLIDIILTKVSSGIQLPINWDENFLNNGYREIESYSIDKSIKDNFKVSYKLKNGIEGQVEMKSLKLDETIKSFCTKISYHNNKIKLRQNIIYGLFSSNLDKKENSQKIIEELKTRDIKVTKDVEDIDEQDLHDDKQ